MYLALQPALYSQGSCDFVLLHQLKCPNSFCITLLPYWKALSTRNLCKERSQPLPPPSLERP